MTPEARRFNEAVHDYGAIIAYWWPRYSSNGWTWLGYSAFIRDRSVNWPLPFPETPASLDKALRHFLEVEEREYPIGTKAPRTRTPGAIGRAYRAFRYNAPEDEA